MTSREARQLRVVILDDESWARDIIKVIVQSRYTEIRFAEFADGDDAWAELSRQPPDLLIADYNHLGMRCEELFPRLARMKTPYCPKIRVWAQNFWLN